MKTLKALAAIGISVALMFSVSAFILNAFAQAAQTHSVTLTWVDTGNPVGTTYNVYRANGLCGGTPTFSKLASGLTVKTFADTTVIPGNFCFQVTAVVTAIEGPPSNTINPQVQPFSVQLSFTQQ